MEIPVVQRFGPYGNGPQYAGLSLDQFFVDVHANWSPASRSNLTGALSALNSAPELPIARYLQLAQIEPEVQQRLRRLSIYGFTALEDVTDRLTEDQIEALRQELPHYDTYRFEGQHINLERLQHRLRTWAAMYAFYQLLLSSIYWHERGTFALDEAYNVDALGLRDGGQSSDSDLRQQFERLRREASAHAESKFIFHPLDTMARLFDPHYFERLLALELVRLTPERELAHLL